MWTPIRFELREQFAVRLGDAFSAAGRLLRRVVPRVGAARLLACWLQKDGLLHVGPWKRICTQGRQATLAFWDYFKAENYDWQAIKNAYRWKGIKRTYQRQVIKPVKKAAVDYGRAAQYLYGRGGKLVDVPMLAKDIKYTAIGVAGCATNSAYRKAFVRGAASSPLVRICGPATRKLAKWLYRQLVYLAKQFIEKVAPAIGRSLLAAIPTGYQFGLWGWIDVLDVINCPASACVTGQLVVARHNDESVDLYASYGSSLGLGRNTSFGVGASPAGPKRCTSFSGGNRSVTVAKAGTYGSFGIDQCADLLNAVMAGKLTPHDIEVALGSVEGAGLYKEVNLKTPLVETPVGMLFTAMSELIGFLPSVTADRYETYHVRTIHQPAAVTSVPAGPRDALKSMGRSFERLVKETMRVLTKAGVRLAFDLIKELDRLITGRPLILPSSPPLIA